MEIMTPTKAMLLLGLLVLGASSQAWAQVTSSANSSLQDSNIPIAVPQFGVVSVKPNNSNNGRWYLNATADGYSAAGVSLRKLISEAYGIYDPKRILDGPDWINSDKYDIEAKVDGADVPALANLNIDQRRAMLRLVLEDRFGLVAHIEEQSLPIYELVVGKKGLKLRASTSDDPTGGLKTRKPRVTRSRNGQLSAEWFSMADLARSLSFILPRPVVDKTGLNGHYDFSLDWTPEDGVGSISSLGNNQTPSTAEAFPSIFTALPDQLGLKLESVRGPVQVLIIDHAERPSSN